MFDRITELSLLFDFYGELLTERKRETMHLYHEENLTLEEIADEFSISKQAVHDALKSSEKALRDYEEKLGLVERFARTTAMIEKIDAELDRLVRENSENSELAGRLRKIRGIIDGLEE
ncbi:MAG: hypothetical protein K6F52_02635 [Clostridia bacterium]|nr:hypothetical protein [Clostridia bacterium]